jgi:hypothetical protein
MNTALRYSFDNIDDIYTCKIRLKSKASFILCGCKVQFITGQNKYIDISSLLGNDDIEKIPLKVTDEENCAKLLSYIFEMPIFDLRNYDIAHVDIEVNNAMSKRNLAIITYLDKSINKFKKTRTLFFDLLDLYVIALDNNLEGRSEDAFFYYFKIVEKISKDYYLNYMKRHHTKNANRDNKKELKKLIKKFARDNLSVVVTEDMLNSKIDLFYKNIKMEFYGSIYNKISLFLTNEKISFDLEKVNTLVKMRNKLAHGDIISLNDLNLIEISDLVNEMMAKRFFKKRYSEIHINSIQIEIE